MITIKRESDKINFYKGGCCVATLFDGQSQIIFDEIAYSPSLIGNTESIETEFSRIGLDAYSARYIDQCRCDR